MKVDIIIPTYNRGSKILELLNCLLVQTYKDFGLIVINDGSTDNTEEYILNFKESHGHQFKCFEYIKIKNSGRSIVRNTGIEKSSAEILIFFDDDVRPGEETVERHVRFHAQFDQAILYGPSLYDKNRIKSGTFQDFRKQYEESWYVAYQNCKWPVEVVLAGINGGNFSVKRDAFTVIRGFDCSLSDAEDFKLAYDLIHTHGYRLYFDVNAYIFHDDYRPFESYLIRRKETRKAAQKMVDLYPYVLNQYSQKYNFKTPANRKLFYKLLRYPLFRSRAIEVFLYVLPKSLRYKYYDLMITANCIYLS